MKDRVLIALTYTEFQDDSTQAQLVMCRLKNTHEPGPRIDPLGPNDSMDGYNQKPKVFPMNWFDSGKEPADNLFFKEMHEPAKPCGLSGLWT